MQLILGLSYKCLPASLKQCFLYCALFPKDCRIQKDELILQWRAQGFIQPNSNKDNNLVDIGDDHFMELLSKSFFQEVTKTGLGDIIECKMHDLMHDLACSITNNECVRGLIENVIDKRTYHFSLEEYCHADQLMGPLSKATHLRTFFMLDGAHSLQLKLEKIIHNFPRLRTLCLNLSGKISNTMLLEFIGKLKHLRYLSIWNLEIKELPNSITNLHHLETLIIQNSESLENLPKYIENLINLKHLNLSGMRNLEFLPDSITKLCKLEALILKDRCKLKGLPTDVKNWINLKLLDVSHIQMEFLPDSIIQLNNLEALILFGCIKLKELPKDIKRLINLKQLDLCGCYALTHMPKGLGELINLQTMNKFVLGNSEGGGLNELDGLTKLRGSLSIDHLEFCIVDSQMKGKFLQLNSGLQELELNWRSTTSFDNPTIGELDDVIYESVLDCFHQHSNLRKISIERYGGVTLCNWVCSNSFGGLVRINLEDCHRLKHLPQFHQFPNLKHLRLQNLPNIEYIIVSNNDFLSLSTFFPSLKTLWIWELPKLVGWWKGTTSRNSPIIFPCLYDLVIGGCPLHSLKFFHAPNLKSLEIHDDLEDELDVVPWKIFRNLTFLHLSNFRKLEYFPECWQHYMTSLRQLSLIHCKNLDSLPEWIGNLQSLTFISIWCCEKLTRLPQGIRHIHNLKNLSIRYCHILEERCKKDTGEDWPKIAHIPKVEISQ